MKTEKEEHYMTLPIFYIVLSATPYFFAFITAFAGIMMGTEDQESNTIFTNSYHIFLYLLKVFSGLLLFPVFLTVVCIFFMRWINKRVFGSLLNFFVSIVMVIILFCSGVMLALIAISAVVAIFSIVGKNCYDAGTTNIIIIFFILLFYWLGIPFLSVYQLKRK